MTGKRILAAIIGCIVLLSAGCSPAAVDAPASGSAVEENGEAIGEQVLASESDRGQLTVRYLDLEDSEPSGDSIVIRSPDGRTMLIDAGTPAVGPQVVDALDRLGIDKIDIAVNTHPHPDHIGGFASVFRSIPVGTFYAVNLKPASWSSYVNAMAAARAKGIAPVYAEAGTTFRLGDEVRVEVLNPRKGELPGAVKQESDGELAEVNNASMVLLMTYRNTRFLFTGDIHREREMELVEEYGERIRADFMDAPHHGISTSSSGRFLEAVSPETAVISYHNFKNFGQLLAYRKRIPNNYVTGLHGSVLIVSDGEQLSVLTEKAYPNGQQAQP